MHQTKLLLSIVLLLIGLSNLQGQDTLKILNSYILLELDTTSISSSATSNMNSIRFCVKVAAYFSDTSDVDSVHIKVGRTPSSQDIGAVSFAYNGGSPSPVLTAFEEEETGFSFCINPSTNNAHTLYLEIWAEDKQGMTTEVYHMHVN